MNKKLSDNQIEKIWAEDNAEIEQLRKKVKTLEAERDALKEQLGKLMRFTAKVENFDYIWMNHSDIPEFYVMMTKGHYATCTSAKEELKKAESRLAEAEGVLDLSLGLCKDCDTGRFIRCQQTPICSQMKSKIMKALRGEAEG
jgi:hypothetical protein